MKISQRLITIGLISILQAGILVIIPSNVMAAMAVDQMIEDAKTQADHEAIAKYYEDEATALQAKAKEHKNMSAAYRSMASGKGGVAGMIGHCDKLIARYEEMAADNIELAKLHRQFAAEIGQ